MQHAGAMYASPAALSSPGSMPDGQPYMFSPDSTFIFYPAFFQLAHIPRYRLRTVTARECGRSVAAVRVCYESRSWGLELSSRRPA